MNKKIKHGIIGAGYLGSYHAEQIKKINSVSFVGVFDLVKSKAQNIVNSKGGTAYSCPEDLLDCCDSVSICTPASNHFEVAKLALQKNCHIFIEKPISNTLSSAKKLVKINSSAKKIIQVGHIERYNPGFVAFIKNKPSPLFIESHRLSKYNVRGLDVPVVLDLMIHDIDLILSIVSSKIKTIDASGTSVVSNGIDLANARIRFENNVVANLTASRISNKQLRQMRVFEKKLFSVVDFENQSLNCWAIKKNQNIHKTQYSKKPINALYLELKDFIDCLKTKRQPLVGINEGTSALEVATKIQKIIENTK